MPAAAPLAIDAEVLTLWWISAAVALVVVIVAAGLLQILFQVVRCIQDNLEQIWMHGRIMAQNTAQLWMVGRVADLWHDAREETVRADQALLSAGRQIAPPDRLKERR